MAEKKSIAPIVIGGGAIAALAFLTGKAGAEPAEEKTLSSKQQAAVLAIRYARAFGVPASLVLALMAVGGWRPKGHVANKRGGAWGYTFMTLATAIDLTKRFPMIASQYWPEFAAKQTGAALLIPAENIALGAYQMALLYKRFRDWLVAALAYYTGAGAMQTLLKQGGGRLPVRLPANVAKMKAAYERVRARDPYVKKALATPSIGAEVSKGYKVVGGAAVRGIMEKLDTVEQARQALIAAEKILSQAYLKTANVPWIAAKAGLRQAHRDSIQNVRNYIKRIEPTVKAPLTDKIRNSVALALYQAENNLRKVDESISDPELRFLPTFIQTMGAIFQKAGEAAKQTLSVAPYLLPLGAGAVLAYLAVRK